MVNKEDLKPGVFVVWEVYGRMRSRRIPAQVTQVNEDSFSLRVLDHFRETELLSMHKFVGMSAQEKIHLANPTEVRGYLNNKINEGQENIDQLTKDLKFCKDNQERLTETVKKIFAQLPAEDKVIL